MILILVSGYYGFDNLGDEAILGVLCADLRALGVKGEEIVVLSNQPQHTAQEFQVTAIHRNDLREIWRRLGRARLFISGGGSLLQDVTSRRSIPYYLGLVELAHMRKVPVVMYGQGLGPVQSRILRHWVGRSFKRSLACSVRDPGSLQFLAELGVPEETIELCADPVFQQVPVIDQQIRSRRVLLNLRPYSDWGSQEKLWADQVKLWQSKGYDIEFIPLGPGDEVLGRTLLKFCPGLKMHAQLKLESAGQVFSGAGLCISMRLHGLIISALQDCLPIGLNYDPKVRAICQQLQIPCLELGQLAELGSILDKVWQDGSEHRLKYRKALEGLRAGALKNRAMLARLLR